MGTVDLAHGRRDLLRVLRNGARIKKEVDDAIDKVCLRPVSDDRFLDPVHQCGEVAHIRESIENARKAAEECSDEKMRRQHAQSGACSVNRSNKRVSDGYPQELYTFEDTFS